MLFIMAVVFVGGSEAVPARAAFAVATLFWLAGAALTATWTWLKRRGRPVSVEQELQSRLDRVILAMGLTPEFRGVVVPVMGKENKGVFVTRDCAYVLADRLLALPDHRVAYYISRAISVRQRSWFMKVLDIVKQTLSLSAFPLVIGALFWSNAFPAMFVLKFVLLTAVVKIGFRILIDPEVERANVASRRVAGIDGEPSP